MAKGVAKIFMHGRSQAVRLPKEFRLPGKEARVTRDGDRIILEPVETEFDVAAWFKSLDEFGDIPFLPEGRPEQPPMPTDDIDWDKTFGEEVEK